MFSVVDKDLFESKEDYICHQTNCVSNGGAAGLARELFDRYPFADCYLRREWPDSPGTILIRSSDSHSVTIINMMGQYYAGGAWDGTLDSPKERIGYFRLCLFSMSKELPRGASYAFPWTIGCGIAGGDWGKYITILKNFEAYIDGDVVIYKLPE